MCCLLTKIEAAQHPAIARHTVRIAFATVAAPHQRHAIASAFATHNKHSEHSLARQQHKPSPRNIQNGRPDPPNDRRLHEQAVQRAGSRQQSDRAVQRGHATTFYKYVMGGGGYDIHYGMFRTATDGVFESSKTRTPPYYGYWIRRCPSQGLRGSRFGLRTWWIIPRDRPDLRLPKSSPSTSLRTKPDEFR